MANHLQDVLNPGCLCSGGERALKKWGNTADRGSAIFMWSDPEYYFPNVLSISYSTVEDGLSGVSVAPWDVLNWGDGMLDTIPDFSGDGTYSVTWEVPEWDVLEVLDWYSHFLLI